MVHRVSHLLLLVVPDHQVLQKLLDHQVLHGLPWGRQLQALLTDLQLPAVLVLPTNRIIKMQQLKEGKETCLLDVKLDTINVHE